MWMTAITAVLLTISTDATIWVNAWEAQEKAVMLPESGVYQVWAWVKADTPAVLHLGEERFELESKAKPKDANFLWRRVGKVDLEAGALALKMDSAVMAVAMSLEKRYDPRKALKDMRVYEEPPAVEDQRAQRVRHTNTVFTMPHYDAVASWEAFADQLRRRILLSSGLYPLPPRTPLNPVRSGRIEREGYCVETLRIEARPGFYVTGNLYSPVGKTGPFPGVVCPHGHWEHGRLEHGERGSIPARCATLARMGMVVFSYDMIGYVDSLQFPHRWGGAKEKLWGIHPFAMQLWSSMRAVDYLESLAEVDKDRLACTGASGGGTQTFALMAVDPRIKVAAPVNMISSTMQGGCLCENAPIIRLNNSNMEIGALMAPRPLLMVSATGDWTRETPHVEFPAIRSIYALYGAADQVENVHIDAPHNYNLASREAMYAFFGKHLLGGDWSAFQEPAFSPEAEAELRVFPEKKLPPKALSKEAVLAQLVASKRAKWQAILPKEEADLAAFRTAYGSVLEDILGAEIPDVNSLACTRTDMSERGDYVLEKWVLGRKGAGDAIPALYFRAADPAPQDAVLLVHGEGKGAFIDLVEGGPGPLVKALMAQHKAVLCIDAFLIGEQHSPAARSERRRVGDFMDTFQPTDTGYRVQDVLTAMSFLRARRDLSGRITLAGLGEAGLWALFAAAMDEGVARTLVDMHHFPVEDDQAWVDRAYIPCIRAVGDLETAIALIAPRDLLLFNTGAATGRHPLGAELHAAMPEEASCLKALE